MALLTDRVAIVTGAGSHRGQGAAEARLLAENGARVVLVDIPSSQGEEIAAEIGDDKAIFRPLDVTDDAGWDDLVSFVKETYGRVDILVNNAGVWREGGVLDTTPETFRSVVEINQTGVFLGTRAVGAYMKELGRGSIINTCSTAGLRGGGWPYAYAASKWAVRGMSRAAAYELAPFGIRVNAICPGPANTPMIHGGQEVLDYLASQVPSGVLSTADDIAPTVLFLASDASSYISGAEIAIDAATNA